MTGKSSDEKLKDLLEALQECVGRPEEDQDQLRDLLYRGDPRLQPCLDDFARLRASRRSTADALGKAMERIALLTFSRLAGWTEIESYRSVSSQHDLLLSGLSLPWTTLTQLIGMPAGKSGILVEAKGTKAKIGDPELRRLCAIAHHHFRNTVGLCVFVTHSGATGFPAAGKPESTLKDARLTQFAFFLRTEIPVVVLDWSDLVTLMSPGSLPRLLHRKIRGIELAATRLPEVVDQGLQVELPEHLKNLL